MTRFVATISLILVSCAVAPVSIPTHTRPVIIDGQPPIPGLTEQEVWQSPCVRAYRLKQGKLDWVPDEGRVSKIPFPMSCGAFGALVHDEGTDPFNDIPVRFGYVWLCDRREVPVEQIDRRLSTRLLGFRGIETKEEHGRVHLEFGPDHCVGY